MTKTRLNTIVTNNINVFTGNESQLKTPHVTRMHWQLKRYKVLA